MKTEDSRQENVVEEATAECRPWLPLSQRDRDVLAIVVAGAALFGVLWWIGYSLVSGLENRLIDRMDTNHRELSAQIEGADRERGAQIEGLERSMVEGFKQSHQRMDRIEARMDGRMDRIESDIDAIEKHLLRIGSAIELDRAPAGIDPAAAPD